MITSDEYFQDSITNYNFTPTTEDYTCAADLLDKVNALFPDCELRSGHRTLAKVLALRREGYRAALDSQHMHSNAVDIVDNDNSKDDNLDDEKLEAAALYREAPDATNTWVHLQRVPPKSGSRTFNP